MGDPSNRNQAHLLQGRSTSRVLAPPGGHSTFSLGGYGGAPDYSTSNRSNVRASAPKMQESQQRYEQAKAYVPRDAGRGSIPGLESHYNGGEIDDRRSPNKYSAENNDSGSNSRRQAYDDDEEDNYPTNQNSGPKAMLRSNGGSLSGSDYAAQLRAQIATKRNIDNDRNESDPYGGRRQSSGRDGGNGQGPSQGSRSVRALADSRHDSAMSAYSNRQESDRERDYRKMQNMGERVTERNGQRGDSGSNYKSAAAQASNSAPVHTSTRIHAPPGGHSSFQIGWS